MSAPLATAWTPSVVASVGGDPSASRTVYGAVLVLVLIGVAFIVLAAWLFRSTRVDLSLLAPLETMSDRKWRKLDPASQRRLLDDERPEGARPLHVAPSAPDVDAEFESGVHAAEGFDDLADGDQEAGEELPDDTAPLADVTESADGDADPDTTESEVVDATAMPVDGESDPADVGDEAADADVGTGVPVEDGEPGDAVRIGVTESSVDGELPVDGLVDGDDAAPDAGDSADGEDVDTADAGLAEFDGDSPGGDTPNGDAVVPRGDSGPLPDGADAVDPGGEAAMDANSSDGVPDVESGTALPVDGGPDPVTDSQASSEVSSAGISAD